MIKSIPYFLPSNSSPSPSTHFPWLILCMQSQRCELMCAMSPPCPKNTVWLQSTTTSGFYKCSTSSMIIFESWNGGYAYV